MHVGSGASIEDTLCISMVLGVASNPKAADNNVEEGSGGEEGFTVFYGSDSIQPAPSMRD